MLFWTTDFVQAVFLSTWRSFNLCHRSMYAIEIIYFVYHFKINRHRHTHTNTHMLPCTLLARKFFGYSILFVCFSIYFSFCLKMLIYLSCLWMSFLWVLLNQSSKELGSSWWTLISLVTHNTSSSSASVNRHVIVFYYCDIKQ